MRSGISTTKSTNCCVKSRTSSDRLSLSEEQTTVVRGRPWWMKKVEKFPELEVTSKSSHLSHVTPCADDTFLFPDTLGVPKTFQV